MKKILLVWGYERIGWIEPFLKLKDKFEFTYLYYIYREEDKVDNLDIKKIYWNNFSNAQDILDKVSPDKIVLMDNYSSYPLVLTTIAKTRKIPTFTAQHGIASELSDYLHIESINTLKIDTQQYNPKYTKNHSLLFLVKSMLPSHPIMCFRILKFIFEKRKSLQHAVLNNFDNKLQTNFYIVFTKYNGRIYLQRDNVDETQLLPSGNYYCDDFFNIRDEVLNKEDYYLLIDQSLLGNPFSKNAYGYTEEDLKKFYSKLNIFSKKRGKKLYVKLHPFSYNYPLYETFKDDNIKFIKNADVVSLIRDSSGCFGMMSTLIIPTLVIKDVCLFDFKHMPIKKEVIDSGIAQILDFENFESKDILMNEYSKKQDSIQKIIELFIFKSDGNSILRLSEILDATYKI